MSSRTHLLRRRHQKVLVGLAVLPYYSARSISQASGKAACATSCIIWSKAALRGMRIGPAKIGLHPRLQARRKGCSVFSAMPTSALFWICLQIRRPRACGWRRLLRKLFRPFRLFAKRRAVLSEYVRLPPEFSALINIKAKRRGNPSGGFRISLSPFPFVVITCINRRAGIGLCNIKQLLHCFNIMPVNFLNN